MTKILSTICMVVAIACIASCLGLFVLTIWGAISTDLFLKIFWTLWVLMIFFGGGWLAMEEL